MQSTGTQTAQQAQQYSDLAKSLFLELQQQAQNVVNEHPEAGPLETPAPAPAYSCATKVLFTGFGIWERIAICCSSTPPVMAPADVWGATIAVGGVTWGETWSNIPFSDLPSLGDLDMQVNITQVSVQISWRKNGNLIANFVGAGLSLGVGVLGGTCKFRDGTC